MPTTNVSFRLGRYSKLNAEVIEDIKQYLEGCVDSYVRHKVVDGDTGEHLTWGKAADGSDKPEYLHETRLRVEIPSVAGLAVHLGLSKKTLYNWQELEPSAIADTEEEEAQKIIDEFKRLMEFIQAAQEARLINNGLSGLYNSQVAKLMLFNHGYSDKIEHDASDNLIDALHGKILA